MKECEVEGYFLDGHGCRLQRVKDLLNFVSGVGESEVLSALNGDDSWISLSSDVNVAPISLVFYPKCSVQVTIVQILPLLNHESEINLVVCGPCKLNPGFSQYPKPKRDFYLRLGLLKYRRFLPIPFINWVSLKYSEKERKLRDLVCFQCCHELLQVVTYFLITEFAKHYQRYIDH